jgi:hypothetical protein
MKNLEAMGSRGGPTTGNGGNDMATETTRQSWARGGTVFAATLMLIIGAYQIFLGITALVRNQFVVVTPNYYYTINTTGWGWVHIGVGIVVALAGFFLFTATTIARIVGIGLLALSALANFFMIPYYPVWSLLLIALDVFAIWSIANVRTDYRADALAQERAMAGYGAGYSGGGMQTGERWPSENQPAGRHVAAADVKEGQMPGETAEQARERAASAGRTMPPGGNPPPPRP